MQLWTVLNLALQELPQSIIYIYIIALNINMTIQSPTIFETTTVLRTV